MSLQPRKSINAMPAVVRVCAFAASLLLVACESDEQIALNSQCKNFVELGHLDVNKLKSCSIDYGVYYQAAVSLTTTLATRISNDLSSITRDLDNAFEEKESRFRQKLPVNIDSLTFIESSQNRDPQNYFVRLKHITVSQPQNEDGGQDWKVFGERVDNGKQIALAANSLTITQLKVLNENCDFVAYGATYGCAGTVLITSSQILPGFSELGVAGLTLTMPNISEMQNEFLQTELKPWKRVHGD